MNMSSYSPYSPSESSSSMIRPSRSEDWAPYRDAITQLYSTMKLKDVMIEMQRRYSFKATEKQYKTQIKKWNLDTKYTKASEYVAMIKTRNMREKENPGKQTKFTLRGKAVDPKDIARFEKRAMKKGISNFEDVPVDDELMEELAYGTPSPTHSETSFDRSDSAYHTPPDSASPATQFFAYPTMEPGEKVPFSYQQRHG